MSIREPSPSQTEVGALESSVPAVDHRQHALAAFAGSVGGSGR